MCEEGNGRDCPIIFGLKEKLSRIQLFAVLLATISVTQEIFRFGQFPTLAMIMAGTFGIYGLIRKKTNIGGSEGLLIETESDVLQD